MFEISKATKLLGFGMKQYDYVAQKVVGTERNLLEIRLLRGIALVYIAFFEGTELFISLKFGQ